MSYGLGGVADYLADLWNWMDWLNFAIFFLTCATMLLTLTKKKIKAVLKVGSKRG